MHEQAKHAAFHHHSTAKLEEWFVSDSKIKELFKYKQVLIASVGTTY